MRPYLRSTLSRASFQGRVLIEKQRVRSGQAAPRAGCGERGSGCVFFFFSVLFFSSPPLSSFPFSSDDTTALFVLLQLPLSCSMHLASKNHACIRGQGLVAGETAEHCSGVVGLFGWSWSKMSKAFVIFFVPFPFSCRQKDIPTGLLLLPFRKGSLGETSVAAFFVSCCFSRVRSENRGTQDSSASGV
jgi:hypothetical protein